MQAFFQVIDQQDISSLIPHDRGQQGGDQQGALANGPGGDAGGVYQVEEEFVADYFTGFGIRDFFCLTVMVVGSTNSTFAGLTLKRSTAGRTERMRFSSSVKQSGSVVIR